MWSFSFIVHARLLRLNPSLTLNLVMVLSLQDVVELTSAGLASKVTYRDPVRNIANLDTPDPELSRVPDTTVLCVFWEVFWTATSTTLRLRWYGKRLTISEVDVKELGEEAPTDHGTSRLGANGNLLGTIVSLLVSTQSSKPAGHVGIA